MGIDNIQEDKDVTAVKSKDYANSLLIFQMTMVLLPCRRF